MKNLFFSLLVTVFIWSTNSLYAEEPVLFESFSKMNMEFVETSGAIKLDGSFDEYFDNTRWTGQNMYYGYKRTTETELFTEMNECAFPRFGNTKTDSYLITPQVNITGGATVTFKVKSFIRNTEGEPTIENTKMKVEYAGDGINFEEIYRVDDMDGIFTEKTFTIQADKATETAKLKFNRVTSTANNRFFISDILVLKNSSSSTNAIRQETNRMFTTEKGIVFQAEDILNAQIFTTTGVLVKQIRIEDGEILIPLDRGIYIIKTDGKTEKLVVR